MTSAELSPASFREKCAEGGRASSSVEAGQENLIALLLQQQQEVLKEIRGQKKELALSQASKEEIARLVLSSLKSQHLQWPATEGSPPPLRRHPLGHATTAGRSKRATKKRRRRKPSCSSDGGCTDRDTAGPTHPNEICASFNPTTRAAAAAEPPWFPQEDMPNHKQKANTIIRQSVEKQAERVEVSLNGLWLPSLPSTAGGSDAAAGCGHQGADRWRGSLACSSDGGGACWTAHNPSLTSAGGSYPATRLLPRARGPLDPSVELMGKKHKMILRRPVTVASSQAPCRRNKVFGVSERVRGSSPHGDNRRSGAVTAEGGRERGRHAGMHRTKSWRSRLESSRNADEAGPDSDVPVGWPPDGEAGGDALKGDATPISQHTAAMLKRSHALVARAKAFCGQPAARSPVSRRGREEVGFKPKPPQGHNSDCGDRHQGWDQGGRPAESLGEGIDDGEAGEAGSILFASPSPAAMLSLRPPGEANAVTNASANANPYPCANADDVSEGGPRLSSLPTSTGDNADGGGVDSVEVGCGDGAAEAPSDSPRGRCKSGGSMELATLQPPSNAEREGEDGNHLPQCNTAMPGNKPRLAIETELSGAAGTGAAEEAEAEEITEAGGAARAARAGEAAEATEYVFEAEEDRQEIGLGIALGQESGSVSWDALAHPGPAELVRQGSAGASSVVAGGRNQGRNQGSDEDISGRRRKGKPGCGIGGGGGGGIGGGDDGNSAKIDTEWENEIAKNILSLYQTKLKDELDKRREAREEEAGRKTRGYLTAEEEEDLVLGQQQQKQQQKGRQERRQTRKGEGRERLASAGNPRENARARKGQRGGAGGNGLDRQRPQSTSPSHNQSGAPSRSCSLSPQRRLKRATTATPAAPVGTVHFSGMDDDSVKPRPSTTIATPARTTATVLGSCSNAAPALAGAAQGGARKARPLTSVQRSGEAAAAREPVARDGSHAPLSGGGGNTSGGGGDKAATGRGGFRGSRTVSVLTRGGGEAVVLVPKRPRPIWFAGSGAVQAEWSALPGGARVVRDLEGLEEQGRYTKYVAIVEGLLAAHLRADDQRGPTELVKKLWKQLVVTCTAFGVRNIENRRFERSLELLKRAEVLLSRQVLDKRATLELKAFVSDAYGLYYLRRGKSSAALDYVQKAMKTHARMQDWGHVTKCHLHSAVVLSKLSRHDEALRCLGQVLSMVEEGKLDVGGNSPQKLCLVAICYHNMAVEQLNLRHAGEACMSSQNARRLARLCLSYSNRWLHSFEGTHKLALAELARALPPTKGGGGGTGAGSEADREQMEMLAHLTEQLFS